MVRTKGVIFLLLLFHQPPSSADDSKKSFTEENYHIIRIPWARITSILTRACAPATRAASLFATKVCVPALRASLPFALYLSCSIFEVFNPFTTFADFVSGCDFTSVTIPLRGSLTQAEIDKAIEDYDAWIETPQFQKYLTAQLQSADGNPDISPAVLHDAIAVHNIIHLECIGSLGSISCKEFFEQSPISVQDFAMTV